MGVANKACKWCELGECWSHGQIERPEGEEKKPKPVAKKKAVAKKAAAKKAPAAKVAAVMKGKGKGVGKVGCKWCLVGQCWSHMSTKGAGKGIGKQQVKQVQQQFLKSAAPAVESNPKGDLSRALTLLLARSVTKEDCVYEVTEENGKHTATLTISALPGDKTEFKGKPAADQKAAQANAARKVLNVLSKEIKLATKAHEEAKAEKAKAQAAIWKEKREATKAEKAAAA